MESFTNDIAVNISIDGKLDINGRLFIWRKKQLKGMICIHNETVACADDCPLMSEPRCSGLLPSATITICENRAINFKNFLDERE